MARIALVTAPGGAGARDGGTPVLDALIWGGVEASVVEWTDRTVDWASFDIAVVLSVWDGTDRDREFARWLQRTERRTVVANPVAAIEWGLDRRSLRDLGDAGTPIVPTTWLEPGDVLRVPERGEVVVKPALVGGTEGTARYRLPEHEPELRRHVDAMLAAGRPAMVQPYLASVDAPTEVDLVYLDGVYSHAVRREPALREAAMTVSQSRQNGVAVAPTDEARAIADQAIATLASRWRLLDARVDIVPGPRGEPLVLDVELVGPQLFLDVSDGAAERFAEAISRWASAG
jgi:hypothetical protein